MSSPTPQPSFRMYSLHRRVAKAPSKRLLCPSLYISKITTLVLDATCADTEASVPVHVALLQLQRGKLRVLPSSKGSCEVLACSMLVGEELPDSSPKLARNDGSHSESTPSTGLLDSVATAGKMSSSLSTNRMPAEAEDPAPSLPVVCHIHCHTCMPWN